MICYVSINCSWDGFLADDLLVVIYYYTLLIGKPPFETSDVKTTYRRIRMNAYTFPEHINISDAGKSLVTRILNGDPCKRPGLDDILNHEFFH
mmetsp:Transcript_8206/g.4341  ORF Transcript_8206/g.4341 Transcript_8206/m.4341 type:complete len:93 (+) Transcript_8206:284-562(+)